MKSKKSFFIIFFILFIFVVGNPSKLQFQKRLQADFGDIHHGVTLTLDQLDTMGSSSYRSWFIFSHYTYRFGNIEVAYLGIAFFKIYLGSDIGQFENQAEEEKSMS